MPWYPHKTVAVVVARESEPDQALRFLIVEERSDGRVVLNQPAGHLEPGESLAQAAIRETLEETAWQIELTGFIGLYQHTSGESGECYIRSCFSGRTVRQEQNRALDVDIMAVHWLTLGELRQRQAQLRSPAVLRVIEDYLKGQCYPVDVVVDLDSVADLKTVADMNNGNNA